MRMVKVNEDGHEVEGVGMVMIFIFRSWVRLWHMHASKASGEWEDGRWKIPTTE